MFHFSFIFFLIPQRNPSEFHVYVDENFTLPSLFPFSVKDSV